MSKILYPVGTQVTLKKFPEAGTFEVVEYVKGEKYPYRVERLSDGEQGFNGKTKFSVKGLKRYNPTQTATEASKPSQAPKVRTATEVARSIATPQKETYSREEVDLLLAEQYQDVLELLAVVDKVAYEAYQKANRIAKVVDTNFCIVSKQFKTLNHDDD